MPEFDEALRQADDERNRLLYRGLVARHGLSPQSLNWNSREGQSLRFDLLMGVGVEPEASVLDVGCGTGDLLAYLRDRGFKGRYLGVDLTPEMVDVARGRGLDGEFLVANLLDLGAEGLASLSCDYVLASGIFYSRQNAPDDYLRRMIHLLLPLAHKAFAFNSLSRWADRPPEPDEYRADPVAVMELCRELTPWVVMRHDYHAGDFTVYLRHEPFASPTAAPRRRIP